MLEPLALDDTVFPTDACFPEPHAEGYTAFDGTEVVATDVNPSRGSDPRSRWVRTASARSAGSPGSPGVRR